MNKKAYIFFAALGMASCNYLEIDPVGKVIPHKTTEFRALLTEGYFRFPYSDSKAYTGLLSDEIGYFYDGNIYSSSDAVALARNYQWEYGSQMYELPYSRYYRAIFQANAVIQDVMNAEKDSDEPHEQILGEAYAIRAYSHFDLLNLYGKPYDPATAATDRGVPLYTQIDIEQRFRPTNVAAVYRQILSDMTEAERLMTVEKQDEVSLNYRFSQNALTAFKARVLLYMRDWQGAYDASTSLFKKYPLVNYNSLKGTDSLAWKGTSPEMILGWERPFSGAAGDLTGASVISEKILSLFDLPGDDKDEDIYNDIRRNYFRKVNSYDDKGNATFLGYCPNRASSDRSSIRIAEMYLIAAEAGAHLTDKLSDAKEYLLTLKAARLKPAAMQAQRTKIEAMDEERLLQEVADERARELLLEGHRWMDLRRTTQPRIEKTYNGSTAILQAGDTRYTLPFPQSAVENNPDLNQ